MWPATQVGDVAAVEQPPCSKQNASGQSCSAEQQHVACTSILKACLDPALMALVPVAARVIARPERAWEASTVIWQPAASCATFAQGLAIVILQLPHKRVQYVIM